MNGPRRQRGVTIVLIVILLVMMVTVGTLMATRSGVQHSSAALSIRAMQAWFAARSGLDWAVHEATASLARHDAICDDPPPPFPSFTLTGGAANGFEIAVSCNDGGGFTEAGVSYEVDLITVTATRGAPGEFGYVSRTVQAVVSTGTSFP